MIIIIIYKNDITVSVAENTTIAVIVKTVYNKLFLTTLLH